MGENQYVISAQTQAVILVGQTEYTKLNWTGLRESRNSFRNSLWTPDRAVDT